MTDTQYEHPTAKPVDPIDGREVYLTTPDGRWFRIKASSDKSVTVVFHGDTNITINGIEHGLTGWIERTDSGPGYRVRDLNLRRAAEYFKAPTDNARRLAYVWFRQIGEWLASSDADRLFAGGAQYAAWQELEMKRSRLADAKLELAEAQEAYETAAIASGDSLNLHRIHELKLVNHPAHRQEAN